jgi:SH3 domain-containing YSC84-like protein 1
VFSSRMPDDGRQGLGVQFRWSEILSYSRSRGFFAGISLTGSTLRADISANKNLCGKDLSAKDIALNHAVPPPPCAKKLIDTLEKASPKKN